MRSLPHVPVRLRENNDALILLVSRNPRSSFEGIIWYKRHCEAPCAYNFLKGRLLVPYYQLVSLAGTELVCGIVVAKEGSEAIGGIDTC